MFEGQAPTLSPLTLPSLHTITYHTHTHAHAHTIHTYTHTHTHTHTIPLRTLHGRLAELKTDYPLLFTKSTEVVRKLGFPDIIVPGE